MNNYKKIEDYGLIGDLDTCALVGNDGSIDWYCVPHIESPSAFGSILDIDKGGLFSISPVIDFKATQKYVKDTNILETNFITQSGEIKLTDFMPVADEEDHDFPVIMRKIICLNGNVDVRIKFDPQFDYARSKVKISLDVKTVIAQDENNKFYLTVFNDQFVLEKKSGIINLREGEEVWVVLEYNRTQNYSVDMCANEMEKTQKFWHDWIHKCAGEKCLFRGPWHEIVNRSSLVLKLLAHHASGAIAAAPTTSLPEEIGGVRNWDYRFSWIRDSSFTVQALFGLGYVEEAKSYLSWFKYICTSHTDLSDLQIMYGLHGETGLTETVLDHLSGYKNSKPVRIGNEASGQRQLDIYGELVNAIYETTRIEKNISKENWKLVKTVVDYVLTVWKEADSGIWEVRSEPQHFVYSKIMCWVAVDRAIKIARDYDLDDDISEYENVHKKIKEEILEKGYDKKLGSFVQAYDNEVLDATSLLIPMLGFLPGDDERVRSTIDVILNNLVTDDCFVYRYKGVDGISGGEGAFVLCSFWLVDALIVCGRVEEAEKIFKKLLSYASPLGLLAEEIDPKTGEHLGNYPQAFSHIGLINSAMYLGIAKSGMSTSPKSTEVK